MSKIDLSYWTNIDEMDEEDVRGALIEAVKQAGSQVEAAKFLHISQPTLSGILNGNLPITPALVKRMFNREAKIIYPKF